MSDKNKYYLPKEEFLTVLHWVKQYPQWLLELRTLPDTGKAITYDKDKVQSSGGFDPNAEMAMRRYTISKKKHIVEQVAEEVAPEIAEYLILGTAYGMTYIELERKGIPCGKTYYYDKRQRFYFELSKRI